MGAKGTEDQGRGREPRATAGVRVDVSLLESIFAQLSLGRGFISHSEWCAMLGVEGDEDERRL